MAGVGPSCGPVDVLGKGLAGPRQGSCRGVVVVPGKDLARDLVGFLGKDLAEVRRLLILI